MARAIVVLTWLKLKAGTKSLFEAAAALEVTKAAETGARSLRSNQTDVMRRRKKTPVPALYIVRFPE